MIKISDVKLIFGITDNTAIELAEAINNKEYGDIRSILDEYIPNPPYWMLIKISQEILRYTGAYFFFSAVDGWSYTE